QVRDEHEQEHADDRADADPRGAEHVPLRHLHELGRPVGHELVEAHGFGGIRLSGTHSFSTSALSLSSSGLIENRDGLAACSSSSAFTMFSNSASRSTCTTMIISPWPAYGASTSRKCAMSERVNGSCPCRQYTRPSARTRMVTVFDAGTFVSSFF